MKTKNNRQLAKSNRMEIKFAVSSEERSQLTSALESIEAPESAIADFVRESVMSIPDDPGAVAEGIVYPNRTTAKRVAFKLMAPFSGMPGITMHFARRGKMVKETFQNPAFIERRNPVFHDASPRVLVEFTAAQHERLKRAAAQIGNDVTVADLVVSGAMSALDNAASCVEDAIESISSDVYFYVQKRVTFASPKDGTEPLQCEARKTPQRLAS